MQADRVLDPCRCWLTGSCIGKAGLPGAAAVTPDVLATPSPRIKVDGSVESEWLENVAEGHADTCCVARHVHPRPPCPPMLQGGRRRRSGAMAVKNRDQTAASRASRLHSGSGDLQGRFSPDQPSLTAWSHSTRGACGISLVWPGGKDRYTGRGCRKDHRASVVTQKHTGEDDAGSLT